MLQKMGWAFSGALALLAVLALARTSMAGPLDPPGPVGSTMRTLDELLPSWGKDLNATGGCGSPRFSCVLSDEAVLDRETGLVWQRVPSGSVATWDGARVACAGGFIGGKAGWRLPTVGELATLASASGIDGLPDGHPFTFASGTNYYWSTTADDADPTRVWLALFQSGGPVYGTADRTDDFYYLPWCVRGPGGDSIVDRPDEQPAWTRMLPAYNSSDPCNSARFECVLGGVGALDRETGLVWDRDPSTQLRTWASAFENCLVRTTGGRKGWRLPTAAELGSIVDPSVPGPGIMLPPGHPFTVAGYRFWSSTDGATTAGSAYVVDFSVPDTAEVDKTAPFTARAWCVRGGSTSGD